MMRRPWSEACERNKDPIAAVLGEYLVPGMRVLELGSGTGQHAVYFAKMLPQVQWLTSDLRDNHDGIKAWLDEAGLPNALSPIELDTRWDQWPALDPLDVVFSANTAHIMHWDAVCGMVAGAARCLREGGRLILYGPFRVQGEAFSDSNRRFDHALRAQDPGMGVRDSDALDQLASAGGLVREAMHVMPANNHVLVWQRRC